MIHHNNCLAIYSLCFVVQIERIKLESGNLATQLSELQQTKEALDNSVKANRETILRLVADGKQHEKTLEQIADMKKVRIWTSLSSEGAKYNITPPLKKPWLSKYTCINVSPCDIF